MKTFIRGATSRLRKAGSTIVELAGFALLSTAAWQVAPELGLAVAGACCLLIAYVTGGRE